MKLQSLKRGLKYTELALLLSSQKWVPEKFGKTALKKAYLKKLTELRGIPLKVSQILSMSTRDDAEQYDEAIDEIEPIPISAWLEEIKNHETLYIQIDSISEEGLSASLGQVHKVLLKGGHEKALKLKYPDIADQMDLDQSLMGLVQNSFQAFKTEGFSLPDYQTSLSKELVEEMDYLKEVQKQEKLYEAFSSDKNIIIPKPDLDLSKASMICMDWEDSLAYDGFKEKAKRPELITAMRLLSEFYFKMLFEIGCLHADPNPGNFGFRKQGEEVQLVVYDYGSVLEFRQRHTLILLKLMQMVDRGEGDCLPWLGSMGFNTEILKPLRSKLMPFLDLMFEPFLSQGRYDLKEWNRKERAKDILGEHRWNFMLSAPSELIFFMRSLLTLFFYGSKFGVGLFLRPYIEAAWAKYSVELSELKADPLQLDPQEFQMAKNLHLHVTEDGRTKVKLSMPRSSVECLEDLMDEDLLEKVKQEQIDLDEIVKKTRQNSYQSGELFSLQKGNKKVRVFLE